MTVTPGTAFSTSGSVGGPFSPTSVQYTVTAASGTVNWSVAAVPIWLTPSATSGTADTGGTVVTFTVNSTANTYGIETISESIQFYNASGGSGGTARSAQLTVTAISTSTGVTSSQNPSVFGQSVTFTATVTPGTSGTPTGTVTFYDSSNQIGTGTLSSGVATFATAALAVGSHTITASYGGDSTFGASVGSLTGGLQVVNQASTSTAVGSSANPILVNQSVTFTATVSANAPGAGTPTGSVSFMDGSTTIGTGSLTGGVASFSTSSLSAASHTIAGNYAGDGNFLASSGALTGNPEVVRLPTTVTSISPTSGAASGGAHVSISGTGLSGATAVKFGSVNATSFTINNDSSITATAPAGTGAVDVTVTTPGGTSTTGVVDGFTYVAAPTVTSLSVPSGPAAGGTIVTIAGTNFTGASAVKFGGAAATWFNVTSAASVTAKSPSGSGTVDVTVTTIGGTSATSAADKFGYLTAPAISGISPSSGPVAGGTAALISGANLGGASAVTFGGNPAAAFTVNSASSISATSPGGFGTVDVRATTPGGTSAPTSADHFTYAQQPEVTALSVTSGTASGGTSLTVSGNNLTSASAVKFGGTAAKSFTVDGATSVAATSPAGTGTVDVTVTTPGGTSATSIADQFSYLSFQQVAWALASKPTTASYHPAAADSFNTTGGTITITRSGTGLYRVALTGFAADDYDAVQVTAYGGSGYCTVGGAWTSGSSPSIPVNCYAAGGKPANGEFSLLYQKRAGNFGSAGQGIAFLLADQPSTASYGANANYQYNSTGGSNTITRSAAGTYSVLLPGFTQSGGQVQVTAVGSGGGRCGVQSWSAANNGTTVHVACVNANGAAADQKFDLAYSIGTTPGNVNAKTAGVYVLANQDTTKKYTPADAYNGLTSGSLTVTRTAVGEYRLTIPGAPSFDGAVALATAYGGGGNYCGIVQWTKTIVYVDCRSAAGTAADTGFALTFQAEK